LELCYSCTGEAALVDCEQAWELPTIYDCEGYRMPTEAEWEYAARSAGAVTDAFPAGGSFAEEPNDGSYYEPHEPIELTDGSHLADQAWWVHLSPYRPMPSGLLEPNALGLYDVAGNMAEWVHDGFEAYDGETTDPVGDGWSLTRGGGHWHKVSYVRMAARSKNPKNEIGFGTGVRLVRTAP
jgi:formylglycine-generating enzyme required for sulfatase activity